MDQKPLFENANPKLMFIFGLVSGVAVVAVLVSGSLLTVFNGGTGFRVAQADSAIEDPVGGTLVGDEVPPVKPTTNADVPAVTSADHIRGNKDAKVVLIEYSDFECPFCSRHHPNMLKLMEEYGDDVAWVIRHFPLSFHPEAMPAAVASECANEQGKFWEYADAMFENQDSLGENYYPKLAKELGLNVTSFESCLDSGKYDDMIASQQAGGASAGVNGTPATFVNGELISGAVPYETLKGIVEAALE